MRRLVMLLASLAQLFGVVAGPLDHWRTPSRIGVHAETTGSRTSHYAHNEGTCVACAISVVAAAPTRRWPFVQALSSHQTVAHARRMWVPQTALHAAAPPRAPPTDSRLG